MSGDNGERSLDAADKIDEATKRYLNSEKGKAALKQTQNKYYQEKRKPKRELAKAYAIWIQANPGRTVEDFLKEMNGREDGLTNPRI